MKVGSVTNYTRKLGSVAVGAPVADLGMAAAYSLADRSTALSALGVGLAGLHAARGAAFLSLAFKEKDPAKLEHRLGTGAGEALVAAGHIAGAFGGGIWSVPLVVAGTALNVAADYRYRDHFNVEVGGQELPKPQLALNVADAVGASFGPAGIAVGALHVGLCAKNYLSGTPETKHARHCQGFGHGLIAAGQLAGAAGAGPWSMAPVLGGMLITNVQSFRDS